MFFPLLRLQYFICLFYIRTLKNRNLRKSVPPGTNLGFFLKILYCWSESSKWYKYQLKIFLTFLKVFRLTNTIINKWMWECNPWSMYGGLHFPIKPEHNCINVASIKSSRNMCFFRVNVQRIDRFAMLDNVFLIYIMIHILVNVQQVTLVNIVIYQVKQFIFRDFLRSISKLYCTK